MDPISPWYFIYHIRQHWGPVSRWDRGPNWVPIANMALSNVIEQIILNKLKFFQIDKLWGGVTRIPFIILGDNSEFHHKISECIRLNR